MAHHQITFQMLVDISKKSNLIEGLVLPPIFKSKLSRNCKSIKLIDINKEYTVSVEDFGHHRVKCCNNQWPNFVTTCLEPDTTKLCFRLLQKNVVEVICFDSDGLQASVDEDGIHSTNRCLVEATYETIEEEGLHGCFLEQFDSTSKREPDDTVVIYGSNQNATVNIVFDYEEHSDTQTDVKFEDGEEEEKTLPKSIVRPYDLHTYKRARLNYGTLKFLASLEVNHDSRRVGDESHVVMKRNWMDFLSKTGLVVGDKIRFQLNMEKSVGRVVDFDVC